MAEIVLGIGASHTPQVSTSWQYWSKMRRTEEVSPSLPLDLEERLAPEAQERDFEAVQKSLGELSRILRAASPLDAIVIFGDDQHEQFFDDNMPAIAVYCGEEAIVHAPDRSAIPWSGPASEQQNVSALLEVTRESYPNAAPLAAHIVESLTAQEFAVARSNRLRDVGLGHAFAFLYQRLWPDCDVPIVPIMINTYFPPNQPTPKRCYDLGMAIKNAIQSWDQSKRVAVIASGGLSHIVLDEPLDRAVLDALQNHKRSELDALPRGKLRSGTSEILNWIALGGAVGQMEMTLVDYVAGFRSPPSTGCGMAFAYWTNPA